MGKCNQPGRTDTQKNPAPTSVVKHRQSVLICERRMFASCKVKHRVSRYNNTSTHNVPIMHRHIAVCDAELMLRLIVLEHTNLWLHKYIRLG